MKKITYLLGLLLVGLSLPVSAEIEKTSSVMARVCEWAGARGIAASEAMVEVCEKAGVTLGTKPEGLPALGQQSALMKAFYAARDNAQKAWEEYQEKKAAENTLREKLDDVHSYKDLLAKAAEREKEAGEFDKKAQEIKDKYEKKAAEMLDKAEKAEAEAQKIKDKYAKEAEPCFDKAKEIEKKAADEKAEKMVDINALYAKADELAAAGDEVEAAKVRADADAKKAEVESVYNQHMEEAQKERDKGNEVADKYKDDKAYQQRINEGQKYRAEAEKHANEYKNDTEYQYVTATADKYHTEAAEYTARAEAVEGIQGNSDAIKQLEQELKASEQATSSSYEDYKELAQDAKDAAEAAGEDYVAPHQVGHEEKEESKVDEKELKKK